MAVPDTDTFSLQDVITELGLAPDEGLVECFEEAIAGSFDSNYNPNADGTNNNLLNFRNYGATIVAPGIGIDFTHVSKSATWQGYFEASVSSTVTWEWDAASGLPAGEVQGVEPIIDFSSSTGSPGYINMRVRGVYPFICRLPDLLITYIDVSNLTSLKILDIRGNYLMTTSLKDQVYIDMDNNGVLNGTIDMNAGSTTASDSARASLIAKGWTLNTY